MSRWLGAVPDSIQLGSDYCIPLWVFFVKNIFSSNQNFVGFGSVCELNDGSGQIFWLATLTEYCYEIIKCWLFKEQRCSTIYTLSEKFHNLFLSPSPQQLEINWWKRLWSNRKIKKNWGWRRRPGNIKADVLIQAYFPAIVRLSKSIKESWRNMFLELYIKWSLTKI